MATKKPSNLDLRVGIPLHLAPKCTMIYKCGEVGEKMLSWIANNIREKSGAVNTTHQTFPILPPKRDMWTVQVTLC